MPLWWMHCSRTRVRHHGSRRRVAGAAVTDQRLDHNGDPVAAGVADKIHEAAVQHLVEGGGWRYGLHDPNPSDPGDLIDSLAYRSIYQLSIY